MLFSRYKVADAKKRRNLRNVARGAEFTESFSAEIDKVEKFSRFGELRVKYLGREKETLTAGWGLLVRIREFP